MSDGVIAAIIVGLTIGVVTMSIIAGDNIKDCKNGDPIVISHKVYRCVEQKP